MLETTYVDAMSMDNVRGRFDLLVSIQILLSTLPRESRVNANDLRVQVPVLVVLDEDEVVCR
jgi:hypothetical protein